ncbi:MAG: hypothetical protein ABFD23_05920 [Caldisericales bacterium]|nr:hypothetical protein [bacterium]
MKKELDEKRIKILLAQYHELMSYNDILNRNFWQAFSFTLTISTATAIPIYFLLFNQEKNLWFALILNLIIIIISILMILLNNRNRLYRETNSNIICRIENELGIENIPLANLSSKKWYSNLRAAQCFIGAQIIIILGYIALLIYNIILLNGK